MPRTIKKYKFGIPLFLAVLLAVFASLTVPREEEPGIPQEIYNDSTRLKKALESFRLEPGLRIELVAAEPLVIDPVAFAFDENQQMYVVEDRGYPDPIDGSVAPPVGRIALLKDTDGDGVYDKRTEFVTGLTYPNGILPWKGGVFVTCAPHIYYFKDIDGDGVADRKDIVLTGFNSDRTAQIRVSHPILGLDGWVYVTSGLNNGNITSPLHPDRPAVSFKAADGRFNPETFEFQSTGGRSQFGLAFDPYGRRFGTSNRHPVQQIMLEPWHLSRNPLLPFSETYQNVSKVEADAVVYPISGAVVTAEFIPKLMGLSHTGTFTSACGLLIFNGTGLTPAHKGNAFICEPAQNLVQRQVMTPDGPSFTSSLPYKGKEFLASTDEWFRPVFLNHGPDGALYLADMYRKVIDHPSYVPEEARGGLDFESGKTDGRIYRIVKRDFKGTAMPARTKSAFTTDDALLKSLKSANEWERETAFRLLLEKKNSAAAGALKQVAKTAPLPESRTKALWLLHALGSLDTPTLEAALRDTQPGMREQAVLLALAAAEQAPSLIGAVAGAANDPNARVRYNASFTLGSLQGRQVVGALATIAARDGADKWVRNAVLSGIAGRESEFMTAFRQKKNANPKAFGLVMQEMGRLLGNTATIAQCRELLFDAMNSTTGSGWQISTVLGLSEGIAKRGEIKNNQSPLYFLTGENATAAEQKTLESFLDKAAKSALNPATPPNDRISAAALLGYTGYERSGSVLEKLIDNRNPPELQLEAVSSISRIGDARGAGFLTRKEVWSGYTPRLKSSVVAALVSNTTFIGVLFEAIRNNTIAPAEIASMDRQRLIKHKDASISEQAKVFFNDLESGGRMEVYQRYKKILAGPASAADGKAVFERACSACHTYAGSKGGNVGPDLTGIRNQPADAILLHVIVPNYEVYPAYQALTVESKDGKTVSGWLVAETENSLTLRTAFSTEVSILRSNIKTLSNPGISLMPDGLEQTMTEKELADLIAFLKKAN